MIRTEKAPAGVVMRADLPPGAVAYVDADWIDAAAPGPVPALVGLDGALQWADGTVVATTGADGDAAAAAALRAIAEEAAAAADGAAPGRVEVTGVGFVAEHVRRLLSVARQPDEAGETPRPAVIVDATGAGDVIEAATRRLDDLGTLVLAGESAGRRFPLNVYADIHSRGLRVVGVGRAGALAAEGAFEPPAEATLGMPLRPARWYRLSGAA